MLHVACVLQSVEIWARSQRVDGVKVHSVFKPVCFDSLPRRPRSWGRTMTWRGPQSSAYRVRAKPSLVFCLSSAPETSEEDCCLLFDQEMVWIETKYGSIVWKGKGSLKVWVFDSQPKGTVFRPTVHGPYVSSLERDALISPPVPHHFFINQKYDLVTMPLKTELLHRCVDNSSSLMSLHMSSSCRVQQLPARAAVFRRGLGQRGRPGHGVLRGRDRGPQEERWGTGHRVTSFYSGSSSGSQPLDWGLLRVPW